ncbi:hypothetical protein [Nocardia sp. NPDC047648]|uniref:hypothetical protein n=1 Tax=Nocardia sp. NPDC047648 TaxID=3155625 RepID=UPI0033CF188C
MTTTVSDETSQAADSAADSVVRVRTIAAALVVAVLAAAAVTFGVLWSGARGELADRDATAADVRQAEQVGTQYAVGASTIDYQDFPSWSGRLKANTTPELAAKFDSTAPKLRDLLTPLRWTSTATPIAAKVQSENPGLYTVHVFLTVASTSAQSPDGAMTTVVYKIVVNKDAGWKITDVGSTSPLPTK